jgi:hypothetical protein
MNAAEADSSGLPHAQQRRDVRRVDADLGFLSPAQERIAESIARIQELPLDERVDVVEEIAFDAYQLTDEGQISYADLRSAQDRGDEEGASAIARDRRRSLAVVTRQVASVCGVELEDHEQQRLQYRSKLVDRLESYEAEGLDDESIMRELGIIRVDDKGKEHFEFPRDIFPPYIVKTWKSYSESVREHTYTAGQFDKGLEDRAKLAQWDTVRKINHDALSKLVQEFFDLESWDHEKCRGLITKMIKKSMPTTETSESRLTADAILGSLRRELHGPRYVDVPEEVMYGAITSLVLDRTRADRRIRPH